MSGSQPTTPGEAPYVVARYVRGRYFHALGSGAADPSGPNPARSERFAAVAGLVHREVVLEFVMEPGGAR